MRARRVVVLAAAFSLLASAEPALAREPLDVRVFARIGDPGQPEPIAVSPVDGRVYVATNQLQLGVPRTPSKIFAYNRAGELRRSYTLRGQPLDQPHGIQGLAFDGDGLLYVLDRSATPRVVRLDPRTGKQRTWARFPDLPSCPAASGGECSATTGDLPPAPDYPAFAPDGRLYVTDIDQALIWRLPRNGGRARLWFTHPSFEGPFGPNGIQFDATGSTMLLAVTMTLTSSGLPLAGALYEIPVLENGSAGVPGVFWRSGILDAPDGFAIARSGNVYLALAGTSQVALISPAGDELARVPADPLANSRQEIPFDAPGSVAFLGRRVLVSNHAAISGNRSSWAVLDVFAGERGLSLNYP